MVRLLKASTGGSMSAGFGGLGCLSSRSKNLAKKALALPIVVDGRRAVPWLLSESSLRINIGESDRSVAVVTFLSTSHSDGLDIAKMCESKSTGEYDSRQILSYILAKQKTKTSGANASAFCFVR